MPNQNSETQRQATAILAVLSARERRDFLPEPLLGRLQTLGRRFECIDAESLSPADWPALLARHDPEILVACWKTPPLPATTNPSLRYACYLAGSVRKFVSREALERGLLVTNWGNSISRVVAECGLMLTLSALRRASHWALAMHREGAWKDQSTIYFESLFERRVGFHGFGAIAQELARLMVPFGVPMAAYSPSVPDAVLARHGVTRAASLDALFAESQVLIELAAYTPANYHVVNERLLRLLPEGATFVNIGRGAVVDEAALLCLAREGRLQIALDVFETEPLPPEHPFRGLRNVTLLPHLGGPTIDRRRDAGALGLRNIEAYLAGTPLEAQVTPEIYDRST